jgi:hypothetical protein
MAIIMSTSEKRRKTGRISVRAEPEELTVLQERADDVGLPVSTYLLASGLGRQIRSKGSMHLVLELRQLGVQQKELCHAYGGALTPEYRAVLIQILAAIDRIGG